MKLVHYNQLRQEPLHPSQVAKQDTQHYRSDAMGSRIDAAGAAKGPERGTFLGFGRLLHSSLSTTMQHKR
jgi:hypothetical protein